MDIPFVVGLDYSTATLGCRQKFAVSDSLASSIISRIINSSIAKEVVILSTCNRTEIYCVTHDVDFVVDAMCDMLNVCPRSFAKCSYTYSKEDAIRHLFSVVCGLKSMVFGETEIVAQIKKAYDIAKASGGVSTYFNSVFQMALAVNKEVRSNTKINQISTSLAKAVKISVDRYIENLNVDAKVLFIGAGGMMGQIAKYFINSDISIGIVNRSYDNAVNLAKTLDKQDVIVHPFEDIKNILLQYQIIISCCDVDTGFIVTYDMLEDFAKDGQHALVIDLSLPLIFDIKDIGNYSHIKFLHVDDMLHIVDIGEQLRKSQTCKAHDIIDQKMQEYIQWTNKRKVVPAIVALQTKINQFKADVLENAKQQLTNGVPPVSVMEEMADLLANKLMHNPVAMLCSLKPNDKDMLSLINSLYELDSVCKIN